MAVAGSQTLSLSAASSFQRDYVYSGYRVVNGSGSCPMQSNVGTKMSKASVSNPSDDLILIPQSLVQQGSPKPATHVPFDMPHEQRVAIASGMPVTVHGRIVNKRPLSRKLV